MIGNKYARRLKKLDIKQAKDLLAHFPKRYKDYSIISKISNLQAGEEVTIKGKIVSCKNAYTKSGKKIQKAVVVDDTGQIEVVWFNQPYLTQTLKPGTKVALSGKVSFFGPNITISSPEYELIDNKDKTIHTGGLVPVYGETKGVSSKWLRSRIFPLVKKLVPKIKDWMPKKILDKYELVQLKKAIKWIHFPEDRAQAKKARKRLAFNELFLLQAGNILTKKKWKKNKLTQKFKINSGEIKNFINSLPFELTDAQKRTVKEILHDLQKDKPMNRLLQGDVGSGKTVVASIAAFAGVLNNVQAAFMAPTEILAKQHYKTLKEIMPDGVKIGLLTGSMRRPKTEDRRPNLSGKARSRFAGMTEDGKQKVDIFIGTHALIYDRVNFEKLGLAVIDEQHRFGVAQRAKLINKGKAPHVLTLTATPIPRTIALTMYGNLDISTIDEMPPGRKRVKTWVVPMHKRNDAYGWIEEKIKKEGTQAFIVCPLIEESDYKLMEGVRAVKKEYKRLSEKVFANLNLGLLHGRLKSKEKDRVIKKFRDKKLDILVSTPVVEVGVDIANAGIMLVEGAERFGLAQLHQLRGRVGRSGNQAYCLLFTTSMDKNNLKRLKAMQKYNSGFKLAEIDLKLRGPGQIYGTKQHGFVDLKIASFSDYELIKKTKEAAGKIIPQLEKYPFLKKKLENYKIEEVKPN